MQHEQTASAPMTAARSGPARSEVRGTAPRPTANQTSGRRAQVRHQRRTPRSPPGCRAMFDRVGDHPVRDRVEAPGPSPGPSPTNDSAISTKNTPAITSIGTTNSRRVAARGTRCRSRSAAATPGRRRRSRASPKRVEQPEHAYARQPSPAASAGAPTSMKFRRRVRRQAPDRHPQEAGHQHEVREERQEDHRAAEPADARQLEEQDQEADEKQISDAHCLENLASMKLRCWPVIQSPCGLQLVVLEMLR